MTDGKLLDGKNIVLTGGGAGIGWGIAQACCRLGARLFFCQRSDGEARAEELRSHGGDARFMRCDISSQESLTQFARGAIEHFGEVHGLVNNAGVTIEGDFFAFPLEDCDKLWTTNVRSIFLLTQLIAPHMPRGGSIVNVSSNHSQASVAGYEMYAATKGAISAMTRSMAWTMGPKGIRVNTLSPGLTRTEAVQKVADEQPTLEATFKEMHADGQYATVEEIGDLAAFLVSDSSQAMTGTDIVADHGMTAQLCRQLV